MVRALYVFKLIEVERMHASDLLRLRFDKIEIDLIGGLESKGYRVFTSAARVNHLPTIIIIEGNVPASVEEDFNETKNKVGMPASWYNFEVLCREVI